MYLGEHLDRRLTWRRHIEAKRIHLKLKASTFHWLINFCSSLCLDQRVLLYNSVLKPICELCKYDLIFDWRAELSRQTILWLRHSQFSNITIIYYYVLLVFIFSNIFHLFVIHICYTYIHILMI